MLAHAEQTQCTIGMYTELEEDIQDYKINNELQRIKKIPDQINKCLRGKHL